MIGQIRFSGLASGLDTENIVKNLMAAERLPMNKLMQQRQWQEWQQTAYRDANAKLLELRGSMEKLRLQSTFSQSKLSSTDSSKVDVQLAGNPSLSSYSISVTELATPAQPASVTFDIAQVEDANTTFESIENFNEFIFKLGNGIDGKEQSIEVLKTDTINSVISKINATSGKSGVTAFFSDGDNKLVLTSTVAGAGSNVIIEPVIEDGSIELNPLGIGTGSISDGFKMGESDVGLIKEGVDGTSAKVTINGTTIETMSNTFTYDGMRITLKETGSTMIGKETDTEAIFNDVKKFVEKYNEVIESLNGKLRETKYRDFPPLLAEQKEDMKDSEIELWEEKAKSGLLRNDSILSSFLTNSRVGLYSEVKIFSGEGESEEPELLKRLSLSQIGITTSEDYLDNGKLIIDEDKLREAINNNLDDVKELFTATSDTNADEKGIAWRIYDQLNNSMKELTAKAGSSTTVDNSLLGKSIGRIDDQISDFERRLARIEDRYWRQFTAMERAIQQANSQSSWLMQQFN